jgi:phospholipase/carboxylesterase
MGADARVSSAEPAPPGWRYEYAPGGEGPVLLMLHGTGGDEGEMIAFGRRLVPGAPLIAPRGPVSEGGMARFFTREPSDPFRFPDLRERTAELAGFVGEALAAHGLTGRPVVAVGYSNGANAATSLLLHHPGVLSGAALLRGLLPAPPPEGLDLSGLRVLVAAGRQDTLIPPPAVERLLTTLRAHGADVTERWEPAGHGLTQGDLAAAASWLGAA